MNKETKTGEPGVQDATNRVHNGQIYANKFPAYIKSLEAIQGFIRQNDILLLSSICSDPAFFIG